PAAKAASAAFLRNRLRPDRLESIDPPDNVELGMQLHHRIVFYENGVKKNSGDMLQELGGPKMRTLICIGLLVAVVATLSGQSGKGTQAPARSATLPSDTQPVSLNRLPVVKREQMDEEGKKAYDLNAGGPGKIAQPTGPGAIALYSPGSSEPLRRLNNYLRRDGNILGNAITELAILVAAREGDSQYIWSAHEPAALKAGVTQQVIDAVKYGKEVSGAG